jgi:hypothetical protein
VHLTHRYLPWGGFNHNVPEHSHDAQGAPNCQSCHKMDRAAQAKDLMLPHIAECAACHGKAKAQVAAAAGSDCTECHGFHNPGQPAFRRQRELAQNALIKTR